MKPSRVLSWVTGCVFGWVLMLGSVAAAEKVTLLLDWLPYGKHAPVWVGLERGIFKGAGLEVMVQRGFGSSDTVKRIAGGGGEFGLADTGSLVIGRSEGAPVKMTGMFADKNLLVAYALKSSGIRTLKDLEGKTIGETAGGAALKMFPAVAAASGLKNWKILTMDPAAKNPSLLAKKVDAILTVHVIYPTLNAKAKEMGDELVTMLYRDYGLDIYSHAWFTLEGKIQAAPDMVRRFMGALTGAIQWMIERPGEGMDIFLSKNPTITNREAALGEWKISEDALLSPTALKHGLGHVDLEKMRLTIDTIAKYLTLKKPVKAEEIYTNEFLPGLIPKRAS